jgi:hypothetical protein
VKIVALVPFDIYPPQFGGAQRCVNLLERIGPVTVIALDWFTEGREEQHGDVTTSSSAQVTPHGSDHASYSASTFTLTTVCPRSASQTYTHLQDAIDAEEPDLIILEHPWLYPFVGDVPFIYDAHNAEAFLTSMRWPGGIDQQVATELETRRRQTRQGNHLLLRARR